MKAFENGYLKDVHDPIMAKDRIRWFSGDRTNLYQIYFFDFDGVLVPHRGAPHHVNTDAEEHMLRFIADEHPGYLYKPCANVQRFIANQDPNHIFVLGQVENSFESHLKEAFIEQYYPSILPEHIIWVSSSKHKVKVVDTMWRTFLNDGRYFGFLEPNESSDTHNNHTSDNAATYSTNLSSPKKRCYISYISKHKICMVDDQFSVLKDFEEAGYSTLHNSEFL